MSKDTKHVAVGAIITNRGQVLLGKKREDEDHPLTGQWHFPGGHVEQGESPEEALEREIEEETGLSGEIFQIVEADYGGDIEGGRDDIIRIIYHMTVDSRNAEPKDDLEEIKWVDPAELEDELGKIDSQYLEVSDRLPKFIEKLKKMPGTV